MSNPPNPSQSILIAPIIGFLNLMGEQGSKLLEGDRAVLSPLFRGDIVSSTTYPSCQVLFLYCVLDDGGQVVGAKDSLMDIIKSCGARLAVVASENRMQVLAKSIEVKNDWMANIILVGNRNGPNFAQFFYKLFHDMWNRVILTSAWVKLAPQSARNVKINHEAVPGTIMVAGIPNLVFGADWFPNRSVPANSEIRPVADALLAQVRREYATDRGGGFNLSKLFGKTTELHVPSFLSALGAMLGFSVYQSITKGGYVTNELMQGYKSLILLIPGKDGHKYLLGDLINWLLFEADHGRLSAWKIIVDVVTKDGSVAPDLIPIVRHVAATLGSDKFGIPNLPAAYMPSERPMAALRRLWPSAQQTLERHRRPPKGWPVDMGWTIAHAIETTPSFPKAIAAQIVMEAAIPMSKLGEPPWT